MKSLLPLLSLLLLLPSGCDNGSSPNLPGDPGTDPSSSVTISPSAVRLDSTGKATLTVNGGESPFTWSVSNPNLGSVTFSPNNRVATYQRSGLGSGVNTVTVKDNRAETGSASIVVDNLVLSPLEAVLAAGINSQAYSVQGGTPPFSWGVSNTTLGTIASTGERTASYIRRAGTGTLVVIVRDSLGVETRTQLTQQ
ncbi:MAG: hypothetical protein U1F77_08490 [Kiritimatiellia bacterium]